MAIIKKLSKEAAALRTAPAAGVATVAGLAEDEATVPTFGFDSSELAELIVQAWTDDQFRKTLLNRKNGKPTNAAIKAATAAVNARGLNLKRAVVISEEEHDRHYRMQSPDEVVFVLPDVARIANAKSGPLLETARLLMTCTPNGI
jgi:hypothetical protein